MKKLLFALLLLISSGAFAQKGHYPMAQNNLLNLNGHAWGVDNNGDTIFVDTTNRIIIYKVMIFKAYPTGGFPSIPNAFAFNSDSLIAGQHQVIWYSDAASTWHALPGGAGGGGGGSSLPFADNQDLFNNSTDASKKIRFSLAGLTTATTRTWTFPDVSGTFARTDAAQTFTGTQTFSSNPVLNSTSVVGQVWTASGTGGQGGWANAGTCATCFVNGLNAFGAATSIGTSDAQNFVIEAHNTVVGTFYQSDGHFAFGNGSGGDPTQLVWIPGTARIDGTITVNANGGVSVTGSSNFSMLFSNSAPSGNGVLLGMNNPYNSGSIKHVNVKGDVSYSSGTNTASQVDIDPAYNTSGAGSYTLRGVYYHPTYTSTTGVVSEIAFENTKGNVEFNTTAGVVDFFGNATYHSGITADFTAATITVPTKTQGDNSTNAASTAYADAHLPAGRASGNLTGQTGTSNPTTFTPAADGIYNIDAGITPTATTGGEVLIGTVTWTDETSASRSYTFLIPGTASGNVTSTAVSFNPISIRAKSGNAITVTITYNSVGTVTYDAWGTITQTK